MRFPGADDLRGVLGQVLEDFAYLVAAPATGPAPDLPICYRASLPGQAGWLVLRGSRDLPRFLADASTGGSGEGLEEDAFVELCNLSASHLVSELWRGRHGAWKAFVPQAGVPAGVPKASVLMDVEGQFLEASFWTEP